LIAAAQSPILATRPADKCSLFLSWDENPRTEHVPDPYYGSLTDFKDVYDLIDRGVSSIIGAIREGRLKAA